MTPPPSDAAWPGCHGVRIDGDDVGVGVSRGVPLAFGTVRYGEVAPAHGTCLWSQPGEAAALYRRPDSRLVLAGPTTAAIEVDLRDATVTVGPGDEAVQRQLVASFALPLLLHGLGVLLVHGSACARDGQAIVVCAESGSGKSSTLVRLVDDGWRSISEDLCAIDLRGDVARVWPGPPWVRVAHGESGPRDAPRAFVSEDKIAWDVTATQADGPTDVARVVLLEAPGGDAPTLEPLGTPDALRALARHAVWLLEPDERGRQLFALVAQLVAKTTAVQARLPRRDDWRDAAAALLAAT